MTRWPSPQFAFLIHLLLFCSSCDAQQQYENNKQLDCYNTNGSSTLGYSCNSARSCSSYLTFRSQAPYQSPVSIGYLLGADVSSIALINGITDFFPIAKDQLVLVPVPCSCSGGYYQHNTSYNLRSDETYLTVANDTYQGLSACQALMAQNPYESHSLSAGVRLEVPIRCACPTAEQTRSGIRYLLTYLITWADNVPTIADRFDADYQAVLQANNLSTAATIFPFTTLLVPLKIEPTKGQVARPPGAPQPAANTRPHDGSSSGRKSIFVGVGIGVGLLALCCAGCLIWFLLFSRRRWQRRNPFYVADIPVQKNAESCAVHSEVSNQGFEPSSNSVSVQNIRSAVESLTIYEFRELEGATGAFNEDHRIAGSVYRGVINGDAAAIKRLKGDVSNEINILKQINHSNVIRLSGFCRHEGNTFLVYEFADNGSLGDWLHRNNEDANWNCLSWKQRVQIAHDVAHGLSYLHNYTNPPYVHQNLKISNILLDGELRAKVANFGMARPLLEDWERERPHLTRHVVGTHGYMAPEYLEHGLVTPKLDVFAFGVVMLQLLSGKEATFTKEHDGKKGEALLCTYIGSVMSGEDARGKLMAFVDPCLQSDYPLDLAYAMAKLAMSCVSRDPASRPSMTEVLVSLSAIYNSTVDWDPSDYAANSDSMILVQHQL